MSKSDETKEEKVAGAEIGESGIEKLVP